MTTVLDYGHPVLAYTRDGVIEAAVYADTGDQVEITWRDNGLTHFLTLDRDLIDPITTAAA